jgi:predicted Rossmann-fold nucleotide-binding protein
VHEGGGKVFGVIPAALQPREVSGTMLGDTVIVGTMHERKALMAEKANFFIALPGGFGFA